MPELSGHCLCGQVRWRYDGPALRNLVCHCESCQRATSSPFTAFIGLHPEHLTWTGTRNDYESSPGTWRGFCPTCGSRLYYRSDKWPEEIHLHAATLDDPSTHDPDCHVVWEEHLPWIHQLNDLPRHDSFGTPPATTPDTEDTGD